MAYIGQSLTEGTRREYSYVATSGQTTFNAIYTVGAVDVYQNGVLLAPSDYTATTGTTVVFNTGAALNDEITIHCHNTFSVADTVSASQGGTFNQPLTVEGDAATVLTVDRATSDGSIVDFKKNGTVVGSIGVSNPYLTIGNGPVGLTFQGANNRILPWNISTNDISDASIDIGNGPYRFKDLYLSGGVYLGGTGAANYLDDYEEGTWTPTSGGNCTVNSVLNSHYVKVGNLVNAWAYIRVTTTNASFSVFGLPFTASGWAYGPATLYYPSTHAFKGHAYVEPSNTFSTFVAASTMSSTNIMISAKYHAA